MTAKSAKIPDAEVPSQMNLPFGVNVAPCSLTIPQTLDDRQILELATNLRGIQRASAWWIGDLILFLQDLFKDKSRPRKSATAIFDRVHALWPSYERSTLKSWASIARNVPPEIRSPSLTFEHHRYIATLADEPEARKMQEHYIKTAVQMEMTPEDLRLAITDTRKGVLTRITGKTEKRIHAPVTEPKRTASTIDIEASEPDPDDHLPIRRPDLEPEVFGNTHSQLAIDAHRGLVKLREWYLSERKKRATWTPERAQALLTEVAPVLKEMQLLADIFEDLGKGGEYAQ